MILMVVESTSMLMHSRKLQIFVSSTYLDMHDERQAAVQAILKAGHIPAGMELFTAGDESQLEVIKQWIEQCDAFLLILGERYGSIEPKSGKSYVHCEYEHAVGHGKPYFSLILNDDMVDQKFERLKRDATDEHRTEHAAFKAQVSSKMCEWVSDIKDLKLAITTKLNEYNFNPAMVGWVRGDALSKALETSNVLQDTVRELRTKRSDLPPSLSEINSELDFYIQQLSEVTVQIPFRRTPEGQSEERNYTYINSYLGMMFELGPKLVAYPGLIGGDYLQNEFINNLSAIPQVWGLVERKASGEFRATPKGKLLVDRIFETVDKEGHSPIIYDETLST